MQRDGKIVLGGDAQNSQGGYDFAVVRYLPDGTLDSSFATNGIFTLDMGTTDNYGYGMEIQPDGKIILAGTHYTDNTDVDGDFFMLRLKPSGTLDSAFGNLGQVITPVGPGNDHCWTMVLLQDGKIVLSGDILDNVWKLALVRYMPNGSLDSGFGNGGKVIRQYGLSDTYCYSAIEEDDHKLVVAGENYLGQNGPYGFLLTRFNPDGSHDTNFANNGFSVTSMGIPGGSDIPYALVEQPDHKIIMAGYTDDVPGYYDMERYNSDGTLDTTFGDSGKVSESVTNDREYCTSMILDNHNHILLGGYGPINYINRILLMRFTTGLDLGVINPTRSKITYEYPNPLRSAAHLSYILPSTGRVSLMLYDLKGNAISTYLSGKIEMAGKHEETLLIPTILPPGIYLLSLEYKDSVSTIKVIKE